MPALFEIDRDAARRWLDRVFADPGDDQAFELAHDWQASAGAGFAVDELIRLAQDVGAITTPGPGVRVSWDYIPPGEDDDDGGRYLVQYQHPAPVTLALAGAVMDVRLLDSWQETRGQLAALDVLEQAVEAANELLRSLGRLVAAEAAVPF